MDMLDMLNQMNTKDLVNSCKVLKVKQSRHGVQNKLVMRKNLIEHYMGRELINRSERLLVDCEDSGERYVPVSER